MVRALSNLDCLVILDNCEHVLDAVGELVEGIVRRCPHTSILATSREALGVAGERVVPLRPLGPQDAGALFWERAVGLGASLPDDADALVAQLCRQLDGLPLAIELAAARTIAMPLADLVARLGERFRLLRGQRRAIERHQTLRATVAWSYDLLETGERRVFEWLSVFSGSFDLDAAQTICRHEDSDALDVVQHVVSLAEKSMVVLSPDGRYTLLETLRQFGEERLGSDGKADCYREAHAAYFENLVRTAHDGLQGPDETKWWARLQQDWANIRGAFHWAVQRGDIERAAAIATNLIWAACYHDTGEPFVWIDVVGSMPDVERSGQLASVRGGQAWAAWERGDMGHALRLGHEAIEAEEQDERERNRDNMAEFSLYSAAYFLNDRETTERVLARSLTRARAEDLKAVESTDLNSYAIVANGARAYEQALSWARQARSVAEAIGNPNTTARAMVQEATAIGGLGDRSTAAAVANDALRIAPEAQCVNAVLTAQRLLAAIHLRTGRTTEAAELILVGLQAMRRKSAWMFGAQSVISAIEVLANAEAHHPAAMLHGAVARSAAAGTGTTKRSLERSAQRLEAKLGPHAFSELSAAGQSLSIQNAVLRAETELASLLQRPT